MEFDQKLAQELIVGEGVPTLRVYGWKPYTISLGSNQQFSDIHLEKMSKDGIDIVKRPTGGRAILHAHELTYSVVLKDLDKSPLKVYYMISRALLCGLDLLGINADITENDNDVQLLYKSKSSLLCFASSAKYEINYNGKKIIGSAQRRYGNVVLQHGSLLLGPQHIRLVDYIVFENENDRKELENTMLNRTIDVETILGRKVTFEEAAECIKKGFENSLGIIFTEYSPISDYVFV